MPATTRWSFARHTSRLVRQHRMDGSPLVSANSEAPCEGLHHGRATDRNIARGSRAAFGERVTGIAELIAQNLPLVSWPLTAKTCVVMTSSPAV
jgi:hypothetical protein